MKFIASANLLPPDQKFDQLGAVVAGLSTNRSMDDEQRQVFEKARQLLLTNPGYASHFEKKIKSQKVLLEQASQDERWQIQTAYVQIQSDGFRALAQLPSLETVKVLGEFLSDETGGLRIDPMGKPPTTQEALAAPSKNCDKAAMALVKVIATAPVEDRGWRHPRDVKKWRAWYEKVKAGSLTFRLKGDPVEYDLNGPASAEKLREIEQGRVRDGNKVKGRREAESEARKDEGAKGFSVGIAVSGILVAAVAVWYFVRQKKNV